MSVAGTEGIDRDALRAEAAAVGVPLGEREVAAMDRLAQAVAESPFNVAGLRSWEDIRRKHLVDSLACLGALAPQQGEWIIDLGSGAGFPGLPLAIVRPDVRVALLEANGRKAAFLRAAAGALGTSGVEVVHARAEDLGRRAGWRAAVDAVVARAVAPLAVLVELALPLCRVGGRLAALKGPAVDHEVPAARRALMELRGEVVRADRFVLPGGEDQRAVVVVRKLAESPERYPRRAGVPARRPL